MNYELLGNGDSHVHWHLFPRVDGDTKVPGPVWWMDREEMWNDASKMSKEFYNEYKKRLEQEIKLLLNK